MSTDFALTRGGLRQVLQAQYDRFQSVDLGTTRELLTSLSAALQAPHVVALSGLRRVGKSTLLAQIAQRYFGDQYYFVNFESEQLAGFHARHFSDLHQALISLFGERKVFLFDEIQVVDEWERFVRRLHDEGYKVILTGSNSSLISKEFGTKLTGRVVTANVFPFSFGEFLDFHQVDRPQSPTLSDATRGTMERYLVRYLNEGGIPDGLKYPELNLYDVIYDTVIYKDIAARHHLTDPVALKEMAHYLLSNPATLTSFTKLKNQLGVKSATTVKQYAEYLEDSWLLFFLTKYAYSVKVQQQSLKKVYGIDSGFFSSVGFSFSANIGHLMENAVLLHLKRQQREVYYYQTQQGYEVDFYTPRTGDFYQVSQTVANSQTRQREVRALAAAVAEIPGTRATLLTEHDNALIDTDGVSIRVVNLYQWLLGIPPDPEDLERFGG